MPPAPPAPPNATPYGDPPATDKRMHGTSLLLTDEITSIFQNLPFVHSCIIISIISPRLTGFHEGYNYTINHAEIHGVIDPNRFVFLLWCAHEDLTYDELICY